MTEENKGIILYAEDYEGVRKLVEDIFHSDFSDYDLEVFKDGTSLEERLNQGPNGVSLVFTDNSMPGIDGSDIIIKYAQSNGFRKVPFVLYTAAELVLASKLFDEGLIAAYFQKPFDSEEFIDKIKNILNLYQQPKASSR